jgi:hypothetical protein
MLWGFRFAATTHLLFALSSCCFCGGETTLNRTLSHEVKHISTAAITRIGEYQVGSEHKQGVVFASQEEFISGVVTNTTARDVYLQLALRAPGGTWHVTQAFTHLLSQTSISESAWSIPAARLACEGSDILELRALAATSLLPVGSTDDPLSRTRILSYSDPVLISCANFARARLHLVEIGWHIPVPGSWVPVSDLEPVRIRCQGIPAGARVQVIVEPLNNVWRWAMPESTPGCTGGATEMTSLVFFGRTLRLADGRIIELDLNTKFAVYATASTTPFPEYQKRGIGPEEWVELSRSIRAASPKVYVERTVLGNAVRLRIDQLGWSNDGRHFLASPNEQVSGSFSSGPYYVTQGPPESIALVVRAEDQDTWRVAGQTQMKRSRGQWIVHVAKLSVEPKEASKGFLALAVATRLPLDPQQPVTEQTLSDALGVSEQVSFHLLQQR